MLLRRRQTTRSESVDHRESSVERSDQRNVAVISADVSGGEGESALDYMERLRCLAINDARLAGDSVGMAGLESRELDPKTLALVRLAALAAVGGAVPSYGAQADAAVSAGATTAEIVDVLVGVVPMVGLPRVVAAAPKLALALGYDIDGAVEPQAGG